MKRIYYNLCGYFYFSFILFIFFLGYNSKKQTRSDITKENIQQCHNIEVSPEEGKIRELTGNELAEDCLIIKSVVSLSKIISSISFIKFLLKSRGFYICIKNIR